MNTTPNIPERRFSTGAISATIWKNKTKTPSENGLGTYNSVTLQRRYKDKNNVWQSTSSMRVNDLPKASLVLQKCYEYLVLREGQENRVTEEEAI